MLQGVSGRAAAVIAAVGAARVPRLPPDLLRERRPLARPALWPNLFRPLPIIYMNIRVCVYIHMYIYIISTGVPVRRLIAHIARWMRAALAAELLLIAPTRIHFRNFQASRFPAPSDASHPLLPQSVPMRMRAALRGGMHAAALRPCVRAAPCAFGRAAAAGGERAPRPRVGHVRRRSPAVCRSAAPPPCRGRTPIAAAVSMHARVQSPRCNRPARPLRFVIRGRRAGATRRRRRWRCRASSTSAHGCSARTCARRRPPGLHASPLLPPTPSFAPSILALLPPAASDCV